MKVLALLGLAIVGRGTGYETLQVSKAIANVLRFVLKVLMTVHILLLYVRTLWLDNLTVTFLVVSCSCKIQSLLLTKDFAELHNQILLLTMVWRQDCCQMLRIQAMCRPNSQENSRKKMSSKTNFSS